jgi:hypothetical protein
MPADIASLGQRLLAPDDPYRVLGDRLADLVDDAAFADLYEERGRAAIPPSVLALVTLFQFIEDVPDREAARLVVLRLDWKYALHLALDDPGFNYSCLSYFRQRLLAHDQERLVFDDLLRTIKRLGFVKKGGKQRTDSLAVLGAVAELSVLETVWETLRLAVRALREADAAWVEQTVPASLVGAYLERRSDYRLSAVEREAALLQVGQDGFWLLDHLASTAPAALRSLAAVVVLQTVWEQRYERVTGRTQVRQTGVPCTERILTPHDPGVRAGEKRGKGWQGDKVHVTETAEPDQDNFLTDVLTVPAPSGDAEALPQIRTHLAAPDLSPGEQYVDSGYISGQQLAQSEEAGIALIGPPLHDTSRAEFKIADFQIDREARQATCPAGQVSVKWSRRTERDGSQAINIQFAAAACAACPLRERCTASTGGRSLHLSEHYERLQARRAEARTPAFRAKMRARPAIEATLSELVRSHGLRQHRYRGDAKRSMENLCKGAACNLKRLLRALARRLQPTEPAPAGLAVAA